MAQRQPNQRILILCEGLTEYYYAMALKNTLPRTLQRNLTIEPDIHHPNDPRSLAREAVRRAKVAKKERNPYTCVWLFFDNDNHPLLQDAFQIIEKENFCIAYSSLCIEHWFILHFENCGRAFTNGAEALSYLKGFWPAYHKTKINHYEALTARLDNAIARAETIRNNADASLLIQQRNPYITVDTLVAFVRNIATSSSGRVRS
jgi:hypothetical protein